MQAVIFDMDGTLLNTLEDMCDAINVTMEKFGYPGCSLEHVRRSVGNGAKVLVQKCLPEDTSEERLEEVLNFYKEYYTEHSNEKTKPYDGILDVLTRLEQQGIPMAIVSNKPDNSVKDLNALHFQGKMQVAIGEREGLQRKPAPDMLEAAAREMGVELSACIYVGDSEVDIITAKNTGIPCVAVGWGFRDRALQEEYGAQIFAKDAAELAELLLNA